MTFYDNVCIDKMLHVFFFIGAVGAQKSVKKVRMLADSTSVSGYYRSSNAALVPISAQKMFSFEYRTTVSY